MLARFRRSESTARLIHRRLRKREEISKLRNGFNHIHIRDYSYGSIRLFHERNRNRLVSLSETGEEEEELKLRNGFHKIKTLDDAIRLFDDMIRSRRLFHCAIDFNKVICVILRMKRYDLVISLYQKMEMSGVSCDGYSMNLLISCFCSGSSSSSSSNVSFALSTLAKMEKLGFHLGFITTNQLMNALCLDDGRIREAAALFDRMVKDGNEPNVATYRKVINGMCKIGEYEYVLNLLKTIESNFSKASVVVHYAIVDLCKGRYYSNAHNLFGMMRERGIEPIYLTYKCMIDGLVKQGKLSEAKELYEELPDSFRESEGRKFQSNKENKIFEAVLQDLSQNNAEASLPDGVLTVPLLRHQRIALSWMAQKETSGIPCSGGILADDQGLGKTISTIALILKERPPPSQACERSIKKESFELESENGRSEQFDHNIDGDSVSKVWGRPSAGTLVVCPISVMRQWANEIHNKVTSEASLSVLVYHGSNRTKDPHELAKYDVLVTTYSIVTMEVPKQPDGNVVVGFSENKKRPGRLSKVSWFRIVLDEAQSIKNHKTVAARACWGFHAKRRWCLSGTPIQNSVEDLYSYFRFLKCDPYASYELFCDTIKKPITRSPVIGYQKLQAILKTVMLRRTKGSLLDGKPIISLPPKSIEMRKVEEERDFYSILERESRDQFLEFAKAGKVKQNQAKIWSMLLRLRQACNHPLLITGGYSYAWKYLLKLAKKQSYSEAPLEICGICNDAPEDAVVSVCGHVFCKECFCQRLTGDNNQCPLASCNMRLDDAMHDSATSDLVETVVVPCSEDLSYESSKIKAALEILQSIARPQNSEDMNEGNSGDGPIKVVGEKALGFSQWTKMLDLLEACLIRSGIQYRRLDGTMSVAARDKAVQDFNTLPELVMF